MRRIRSSSVSTPRFPRWRASVPIGAADYPRMDVTRPSGTSPESRLHEQEVTMLIGSEEHVRHAEAPGAFPRRWLAAVVRVGAVLLGMIDVTIVNVALRTIGGDLGASGAEVEWVVSAYMLAFAAVLITAGSLGDLLGRRRIFVGGVAGFGVASLAAGIAQDPG